MKTQPNERLRRHTANYLRVRSAYRHSRATIQQLARALAKLDRALATK